MSRRRRRSWALLSAAALMLLASTPDADATQPLAAVTSPVGSQGIDTSLAATDSQVTVSGHGAFAALQVTVNQTQKLNNQAVSVTWTGGSPTITSPGTFTGNFLQIMQCWGEDDGSVPGNPGPPPDQCQFGAVGSISVPPVSVFPDPSVTDRMIGVLGWPGLDSNDGYLETCTGIVWRPFKAVNGTEVKVQRNAHCDGSAGDSWMNPFFNATTTNEIPGGRTFSDGTGAEIFEVQTGLEAPGLGCGQKMLTTPSGAAAPKCWLVVVPRGDAAAENAGTPLANAGSSQGVGTSPLRTTQWKNRIAIPLDFIPVDSSCALGNDERRISGNDLMTPAVSSWQPVLCSDGQHPPYSFAPVGDAAARQQLAGGASGGPGMVITSGALDPANADSQNPVVYAPLGVSGLAIGFNVERTARLDHPEENQYFGVRVADLYLTPRLVAKLLTQSYKSAVSPGGTTPTSYTWATANPLSLISDPDFLRFNPEFELMQSNDDRTFSGLQLPSGTSDAAQRLWTWVLSDPETAAWLAGTPDAWGMKVNPYYSTSPSLNPNGSAFGLPAPQNFPKADPYCFRAPPRGVNGTIIPPPLCGTDWMPYSGNYAATARVARTAYDAARIVDNQQALNSSEVWGKNAPQLIGRRMMLALTDTTSAAQYGVQVAKLSRAGDDGDQRQFIAADAAGMTAAVAAMVPSAEPAVIETDFGKLVDGAYPLTMVSYAAIKPLALDTASRADFAAFLEYASGAGQVPGTNIGQLPRGYTPLTSALTAQAVAAVVKVRTMVAPPITTTSIADSSGPGGGFPSFDDGSSADPGATPQDSVPFTESPTTSTTPRATVSAAGARPTTPFSERPQSRYAIVGLGVFALVSAFGALEITKRPRRSSGADLGAVLVDVTQERGT